MFLFTAKLHPIRMVAGAMAVVLLCGAVVLVGAAFFPRDVSAGAPAAASPKGIKTAEERVAYLQSFGWQVGAGDPVTEELLVPKEFTADYDTYLALQEEQGFDLTKYCGKRVKRYTFIVTNHPSGEENVQANLLLYKNTVIGGEVLSSTLGGFLQGLAMTPS